MASSSLFIKDSNDPNLVPIILVDASGSTGNRMPIINKTVFETQLEVIQKLGYNNYRVIFWCSQQQTGMFKDGTFMVPYVVKSDSLSQLFKHVQANITGYCCTFPALGFEVIPKDWISKIDITKIYYVTDGMISGGGERPLAVAIQNLVKNYPKVELNIITVETIMRDFNQIESLSGAAGCDVFRMLQQNSLTGVVTKFVSYTPTNMEGYTHISKVMAPPGFIAFGDQYFSELHVQEFIMYIMDLINECKNKDKKDAENSLLSIVQKLSTTICALTKDKSVTMKNNIIHTFCNMFVDTCLDMMFVNFIITDAVLKESGGQASIFAEYRARMNNIYKAAETMLNSNVKESIGLNDQFCSLPIIDSNGQTKIIIGHANKVTETMVINGITYPNAGIKINNVVVPVLPLLCMTSTNSPMNKQCLRQWIRCLISRSHNIDVKDDSIIYIVLAFVLQVVLSDNMPEHVKISYQQLGKIMLEKKRLNTDQTELERLERGEIPTSNTGGVQKFIDYMKKVMFQIGLTVRLPMTMWYILCLALGNEKLADNQWVHCKVSVEDEFGKFGKKEITLKDIKLEKQFVYKEIPKEEAYDYNCLITLDNVETVGGYRFLPHTSLSGQTCHPIYVLSNSGYESLCTTRPICPICYANLTTVNFEQIGPKVTVDYNDIISSDTKDIYTSGSTGFSNNISSSSSSSSSNISFSNNIIKLTRKDKCILVIMKGVVGSGKTTFTKKLTNTCESQGIVCIVEGVDKYSKLGMRFPEACQNIKENISKIDLIDPNVPVVVCIDTCGEQTTNKINTIFDVDFTGWKRLNVEINCNRNNLEQYLAWSLRNVLIRGPSTPESDYCLNPSGASLQTCIDVHTKKAKALFGKRIMSPLKINSFNGLEKCIENLNDRANSYNEWLLNEGNALTEAKITKIIEIASM